MDTALADLAGLLRANGLRVSPAEVADAVQAAALTGVADRAALQAALRATLVKRAADVPLFDKVFALQTSAAGRLVAGLERGLVRELEAQGLLEGDDLEMIARTLAALAGGLSPLARAALAGDAARLAQLLRGAALQLDLSTVTPATAGFQARRLLAAAGGAGLEAELAALAAALEGRGLGPEALQLTSGALAAALRQVEAAARRVADLAAAARAARRAEEARAGLVGAAAPEEAARVERAVRRLAERLRARLLRRARSHRRGALAARRTLRRNLGLGGLPAHLAFRRRRPERPELLVLCDVSDSVRHATRRMLLFLHALQEVFVRVRTFVFVADVAEVTAALRGERDPARAAGRAVGAVDGAQNSNCGRALRTFHRDLGASVTRRTTVLVIGDGRNNYHPPEAWVLAALRRRARRVLWICPEPRAAWGSGDSDLPLYAAHCQRVAEVVTLDDLERVADALVPA
jgi:uncharacterized protein with von Willebrand factor type A (vWA) domain